MKKQNKQQNSKNPARSFGPALFSGEKAISQLWIYFIGPFIGAFLGALIFIRISEKKINKALQ